ncbi:MAG: SDR family oxidoreductase [Pseudomonadota bacterium]
MKVVLTGDRGYIGAVLSPMLLARGYDLLGIDSDLFRACTFSGSLADYPMITKDSRDIVASDIAGADAIIHLAGLSNDPLGDYRPGITEQINQAASVRLAKLAKESGVQRFLFASSCSNYGAAGDNFLDEHATFNPVTPYGHSKVGVEQEVGPLADDNFTPVYLRASTAYGYSPRIRFDLVINNLTAWAYTTGKVRLKSDGMPWRPVVHVEDIALAYIAALEAEREVVHNKAFNVGVTAENYRIRDLAEIVRDEVPGSEVTFADDAAPDKRNYRVDCNLIARELPGFKPQWTARRGVKQLYEVFRETDLTLEQFEGEAFNRIAHIKGLISKGAVDESLRYLANVKAA